VPDLKQKLKTDLNAFFKPEGVMLVLTVIILAFNAMPYLLKALASLQAQSLKAFERIFWDNRSTDVTVEEAKC